MASATTAAMATGGRIVKHCPAEQLALAFTTNVYLCSLSVSRLKQSLRDLSHILCRLYNTENLAPRNLDETDLLVRYVRGISLSVSSRRLLRVRSRSSSVPDREIPHAPRSRPDAVPTGNRFVDRVVSTAPDEIRVHADSRRVFSARARPLLSRIVGQTRRCRCTREFQTRPSLGRDE